MNTQIKKRNLIISYGSFCSGKSSLTRVITNDQKTKYFSFPSSSKVSMEKELIQNFKNLEACDYVVIECIENHFNKLQNKLFENPLPVKNLIIEVSTSKQLKINKSLSLIYNLAVMNSITIKNFN